MTPADRVQIGPVGLHPIIVLRIPAVEMHLEGKRLDLIKGEHRGVAGHVRGAGGGATFSRWSSVSTIVAARMSMGFLLSTASTFIPIWKP